MSRAVMVVGTDVPGRAANTLLGGLVGDALGRPFEGTAGGDLPWLHGALARRIAQPRGWGHSDDGEVLLGHAASLALCGRLDELHLLRTLAERFEPARGYGKGMRAAFRYFHATGTWEGAAFALWAEGSVGNGAAVRIPPIALLHRAMSVDIVVAEARRSARVTHGHPLAIDGAVAVAVALHSVLGGLDAHASLACAAAHLTDLRARVIDAGTLAHADPAEALATLGHGVDASESVPAALWAWAGASSYEDAVTRAISLGGDTDSIAAIAGALAAAAGHAIPATWVAALEPRAVAEAYTLGEALERCALRSACVVPAATRR